MLRVEGTTINIFSNDSQWLSNLNDTLGNNAFEYVEPENQKVADYLLKNPTHLITPHKGFRYKLVTKFLRKTFPGFGKWCTTTDSVKISGKFRDELLSDSYLSQGRAIYVKDEKALNIVILLIGEGIQSTIYLVDPKELDI